MVLGAVTATEGLAGYVSMLLATWTSSRLRADLRSALFIRLVEASPDFHDRRPLGDVLTRLSSDTAAVQEFSIDAVTGIMGFSPPNP